MSAVYDVAILGAGPTGLFAAFYARMRQMQAVVLDALPEPGGQLTALYPEKNIYDVPGFPKIMASHLVDNLLEQARSEFVHFQLGEQAITLTKIDDGYRIETDKGSEITARTIVIAAGVGSFKPTRLGIEGEDHFEGRGLYYFAKDYSQFVGHYVSVVGGGDSAVDWANELVDCARHVNLIHRRDKFRAHASSVAQLKRSAVELMTPGQVKELRGGESLASIIVDRDGTDIEVPCTRLILALGFKANLGPLKDWGLNLQGNHVEIDGMQRTNLPGVFAAGDICMHPEYGNLKLIVVGQAQAAVAISAAKMHIDPSSKLFPGHSSSHPLNG